MKRTFLDILACPGCKYPLEVSIFKETQFKPGSGCVLGVIGAGSFALALLRMREILSRD
jgi:uncharacterized protein YbaR (Trm112 family)